MQSDWLTQNWCLAKYYSLPSSGARLILKVLTICQYIVKNKVIFKSDSYLGCVVYTKTAAHFTVVCLVTLPLSESEAGGDLALIQTFLPFIF